MSIIRALEKFYEDKEKRNWDKGYFFIDVHATILKPNYQHGNIPKEFYYFAKETLEYMSGISEICLILYTCSHPHEIEEYLNYFKSLNINFKYVNENPEVKTDINGYGCYDKKPYMNLILDDKAGFNPDIEWKEVYNFMVNKYGFNLI